MQAQRGWRPGRLAAAAGALVVVAAVLGAVVGRATAPGEDAVARTPSSSTSASAAPGVSTPSAPSPSETPAAAAAAPASDPRWAVGALLAERGRAVVARDRAAWIGTAVPGSPAAAAQRWARLSTVRFARWDYDVLEVTPALAAAAPGADRGYAVRARLATRLAEADTASAVTDVALDVVERDGTWTVLAERPAGQRRAPWDVGEVTMVEGLRTLVVGVGGVERGELTAVADLADQAVAGVREVWGPGWDDGAGTRAVVVVPATTADLGALLGRDVDRLDQIAAVATVEGAGTGTGAARVWVHRSVMDSLTPLGRLIVLRHELLHVATGAAATSATPLWLEEGLAEYVGYRGSGVPVRVVAGDVLPALGSGRLRALPGDDDFDAAGRSLASAYERAWLACRYVASRWGEKALLAWYRAVAAAAPGEGEANVDAALASELGTDRATWMRGLRTYLERTAASGGEVRS